MIEVILASALTAEGMAVIGFGLTLVSELLALSPARDNSIVQLLGHAAKSVGKKTDGDDRALALIAEIERLKDEVEVIKEEGVLAKTQTLGRGR